MFGRPDLGRAHYAVAGAIAAGCFAQFPVAAADLGAACCADLEERIAELEANTVRKGNRKVSLSVSGLINETIMFWDDGVESNAYIVTNETKRTRINFAGKAKITTDVSAGYVIELGPRGGRQDRKDQDDNSGSSSGAVDVRYSYWLLQSKSLGQISLGLQPQAYDTITETTVANTGHFARPAPTQQFGDTGGGYFLRLNDGTLSTLRFGNIVTQGVNGTPGEGHRVNVLRYDTPAWQGFTASASWGEDDVWDVALRYAGEQAGFKMAFGAGYAHWTDGSGTGSTGDPRGCARRPGGASPDIDCSEIGLSGSIMHLATGLFATGVYGHRQDDNITALYGAGADDTQDFYAVQAGIEQQWLPLGKTTIFGEYWRENAGPGLTTSGNKLSLVGSGLPVGLISNAEITMWGIGANQQLAEGVEAYVSYRHVEADVFTSATGVKTGAVKTGIEPFQYVTVGSAIKF